MKIKHGIVVAVIVFSFAGLTTVSFAGMVKSPKTTASAQIITGKVVSINPDRREIVIKDKSSGAEKTVVVDAAVIASLKVGDEVQVVLTPGSNKAKSVKKAVEHKTK